MTEVWTPAQYNAYQLTGQEPAKPPRFLTLDPDAPEEVLQGRIQQLCLTTGHYYYHAVKSRLSTPGWPDCAIVHPDGDRDSSSTLFLWELKRKGEVPSAFQKRWLDALEKVTRIEVGVYRPSDVPLIIEKLRRK